MTLPCLTSQAGDLPLGAEPRDSVGHRLPAMSTAQELQPDPRGPGLMLGEGVEIGAGVAFGAYVVVHAGTVIGEGCVIEDHAV